MEGQFFYQNVQRVIVKNSVIVKFFKTQEANGLLNKLEIKTSFSKISLLSDVLF